MPLLHPRCDIATAGDFPVVDMRCVAEGFELVADPVRPFAIAARVANENIGHAAALASDCQTRQKHFRCNLHQMQPGSQLKELLISHGNGTCETSQDRASMSA